MTQYRTILADPPWELSLSGKRKRAKGGHPAGELPYPTMTTMQICAMEVGNLAAPDCHLWLWTTNQHIEDGFQVMRAWGFKYLAPIHWVKPTGIGNWFVHRTQTMLFGYHKQCRFPAARYMPNVFATGDPGRHSEKPEDSYKLIEAVSPGPRIELFSRRKRPGWQGWGNEYNDAEMTEWDMYEEDGPADLEDQLERALDHAFPVLGAMPKTTRGEVQAKGRGKTGVANTPTGARSVSNQSSESK